MALNGSGSFSRLFTWVTDKNANVKITASRMDAEFDGMATALSTALYKDGQQTPTANIPMGGYKLTGLGDATAATDAMNRQTADARYMAISTAAADLKALLDEGVHTATDVASATTCDIGAAATDRVRITGTTTITGFGTDIDAIRFVHFADALLLTHNATSLILPTGANITTVAGDAAIFSSDASGNWRCLDYQRADGTPLALGALQVATANIAADAVTYAKLQNVSATQRLIGRNTSGAGDAEEMTLGTVFEWLGASQGAILFRDASSWNILATGTAGQHLKAGGAGANPSWAAAPVTDVRLGTEVLDAQNLATHDCARVAGNVMIGLLVTNNTENYYLRSYYKPLQIFVNGSWSTVSG